MKKVLLTLLLAVLYSIPGQSATFSSVSSGTWSAPATWSITGTDADGIPDQDDNVIINAGHTISMALALNRAKTLVNNGALVGNSKGFHIYGNFTNNGSVTSIIFYTEAPCVLTSSTTFTGAVSWYINGDLTIAAGTNVSSPNVITVYTAKTISNFGNAFISSGLNLAGTAVWRNETNSVLTVNGNITGTGTLIATGTGNTVSYRNNACTQIKSATYYNLISQTGTPTRTATGNIIVLNNLTFSAGTGNLDLANFNLTVGGNWSNLADKTILNQGIITLNPSGTQTITRSPSNTEILSNATLSGTGTTVLGCNLTIAQNLTVSSGAFDVGTSNFTLNLGGNLTNNGSINCRAGNINLNGSTLQTITGTAITTFYNLTLANSAGAVINSPQSLSNALTISAGNFNSNGNFTLLSDASKTARIAPLGATGSISNAMTIQKFISARVKGWHDLSSPVQNTTINDWDNEMYMSGIGPDDGTPGPAGVDGSASGFYSVNTYLEPTAKYKPVIGSSTPLVVGTGYETWLADDQTSWFSKIIDTRGVPNTGTVSIPCSFAGPGSAKGYNLIGNPFASAITFSACTRTKVNANVLLLDGSGNVTSYGSNATIPSHQGFWVIANATGASISISESAKSSDLTTNHYRKTENYGIKLLFSSPMLPYYNENTINFEPSATMGFDNDLDAPYITSPVRSAPALFMINSEDEGQMITNTINADKDEVQIPLGYYTPIEGTYYIQPNILNTSGYDYVWIENTKTGKRFDLNNGSMPLEGKEDAVNTDYVLHLSKISKTSSIKGQSAFSNDLIVFNTENAVTIKAINDNHILTSISIYDLSGKLILSETDYSIEAGNVKDIDISALAKGIYVVQVIDNAGNNINQKIIR